MTMMYRNEDDRTSHDLPSRHSTHGPEWSMGCGRSTIKQISARAVTPFIAMAMCATLLGACGVPPSSGTTDSAAANGPSSSRTTEPKGKARTDTDTQSHDPWNQYGEDASHPQEVDDPHASSREDLEPARSLTHTVVMSFTSYSVVDEHHIRIFFTGGTPACQGYQATAKETADTVTVTLVQGLVPDAPDACTLQAVAYSMMIELKDPLGARTVVAAQ
ncbi:hypothetical protein [Bifidobacterium platyrrhinorum]|uniref:Uncharacterized protein n=1 Tax=Bifidobacterium platyrrhinorum TaxID=2661628 RepID=A0A6L9ST42_9BIFI|nr:hypothetical protein [Bifidobacterium platyrrhinorum]NEG54682.1 hypothetical protein [Bifidobacterium platyrrhinorum]